MSRTEGEHPADLGRLRQRLDEYRRRGSRGKALPGVGVDGRREAGAAVWGASDDRSAGVGVQQTQVRQR